jgi:hypothetical protein
MSLTASTPPWGSTALTALVGGGGDLRRGGDARPAARRLVDALAPGPLTKLRQVLVGQVGLGGDQIAGRRDDALAEPTYAGGQRLQHAADRTVGERRVATRLLALGGFRRRDGA